MVVDEGQELVDLPLAHAGPQAGVQGRSTLACLQGYEAPAPIRRLSVGRMALAPPRRAVAAERAAEEVAPQGAQEVGHSVRELSLCPRRHGEGLDRLARLEGKGHRRQVSAATSERRPDQTRAERPRRLAENSLESRRVHPAAAQRGISVRPRGHRLDGAARRRGEYIRGKGMRASPSGRRIARIHRCAYRMARSRRPERRSWNHPNLPEADRSSTACARGRHPRHPRPGRPPLPADRGRHEPPASSPCSSDGSTRPCCTCPSPCCSWRCCWKLIRLPGLVRVAPSFPGHRPRFRPLACGAQRLCGRRCGVAPVARRGLRRAAPRPAPLERRRHRHRRVRVRGAAIPCDRAAGPGRPAAPGHRRRGGHLRHDDRRRSRRRQPDARRGLPDGARAGTNPSPGGSSHPSRSLARASHADRRSSGLRRRGPAHLRTALHLVPQPGQAQGRPEAGHVRGSPGRRSVGACRRSRGIPRRASS